MLRKLGMMDLEETEEMIEVRGGATDGSTMGSMKGTSEAEHNPATIFDSAQAESDRSRHQEE